MIRNMVAGIFVLALASCMSFDNITYLKSMDAKFSESNIDVKKLQFYISSKLILKRPISSEEMKSVNGNIVMENMRYYQEIIINENTPCVVVDEIGDELSVQFEAGDNKILVFKLSDDGSFRLKSSGYGDATTIGTVMYDNQEFTVRGSRLCSLYFKQAKIVDEKTDQKILNGMTVK